MNRGKETVLPSLPFQFPHEKALSDAMATSSQRWSGEDTNATP